MRVLSQSPRKPLTPESGINHKIMQPGHMQMSPLHENVDMDEMMDDEDDDNEPELRHDEMDDIDQEQELVQILADEEEEEEEEDARHDEINSSEIDDNPGQNQNNRRVDSLLQHQPRVDNISMDVDFIECETDGNVTETGTETGGQFHIGMQLTSINTVITDDGDDLSTGDIEQAVLKESEPGSPQYNEHLMAQYKAKQLNTNGSHGTNVSNTNVSNNTNMTSNNSTTQFIASNNSFKTSIGSDEDASHATSGKKSIDKHLEAMWKNNQWESQDIQNGSLFRNPLQTVEFYQD